MISSHFEDGHPRMVDVSAKAVSVRSATAEAVVRLPPEVAAALDGGGPPMVAQRGSHAGAQDGPHLAERAGSEGDGKGDAVAVAELAGIMAAKRTPELIPLCHTLPLSSVRVRGVRDGPTVRFEATCKTTAQTGVEMEALTAASVAALTLYDMLKSAGHGMVIESVRLLAKDGGRSGAWRSTPDP